jgi:hypothetical protein
MKLLVYVGDAVTAAAHINGVSHRCSEWHNEACRRFTSIRHRPMITKYNRISELCSTA